MGNALYMGVIRYRQPGRSALIVESGPCPVNKNADGVAVGGLNPLRWRRSKTWAKNRPFAACARSNHGSFFEVLNFGPLCIHGNQKNRSSGSMPLRADKPPSSCTRTFKKFFIFLSEINRLC